VDSGRVHSSTCRNRIHGMPQIVECQEQTEERSRQQQGKTLNWYRVRNDSSLSLHEVRHEV